MRASIAVAAAAAVVAIESAAIWWWGFGSASVRAVALASLYAGARATAVLIGVRWRWPVRLVALPIVIVLLPMLVFALQSLLTPGGSVLAGPAAIAYLIVLSWPGWIFAAVESIALLGAWWIAGRHIAGGGHGGAPRRRQAS